MNNQHDFCIRYQSLLDKIDVFCKDNNIKAPRLIAVSKTRTVEEIETAWNCGIRDFGENYSIELFNKIKVLPDANWHFIGHLQRGNVKHVLNATIHTIDSKKLVDRLVRLNFSNEVMIQVNISGEDSKSGIEFNSDIINDMIEYSRNKDIKLTGLMAIANPNWNADETIVAYRRLTEIGKSNNLDQFSYGMSSDWREALLGGSTILRIGTSIFGPRAIKQN